MLRRSPNTYEPCFTRNFFGRLGLGLLLINCMGFNVLLNCRVQDHTRGVAQG